MDLLTTYSMGVTMEYLRMITSFKSNVYVKGERFIIDCLKWIHRDLLKNELSEVTQLEIEEIIKKLDESYDENQTLKDEDAIILNDRFIIWSDRIQNELNERKVIKVFTDGVLNPKQLLIGGKGFFREEMWNELSDISKNDLNDACNCILTQSWTPAVMISLRAAEDSIRGYYKLKTGKDLNNWKQIIDELRKTSTTNEIILGYFDYIRVLRNTAAHPDKIFDQMEAEGVFHKVVDIINVISQN